VKSGGYGAALEQRISWPEEASRDVAPLRAYDKGAGWSCSSCLLKLTDMFPASAASCKPPPIATVIYNLHALFRFRPFRICISASRISPGSEQSSKSSAVGIMSRVRLPTWTTRSLVSPPVMHASDYSTSTSGQGPRHRYLTGAVHPRNVWRTAQNDEPMLPSCGEANEMRLV
jgi:hypothetical protein